MTTPALQSEDLARAVQAAIAEGWDAARDEVEARWSATAPLPIPDVSGFGFGFKETIQAFPAAAFPYVSVLAAAVAPAQEGSDQGWTQTTHQLLVETVVHVSAADETDAAAADTAMVLAWRTAEVIAVILRHETTLAGFELVSAVPTTIEGQPLAHRPRAEGGRFTGWLCGRVLQYQAIGEYAP